MYIFSGLHLPLEPKQLPWSVQKRLRLNSGWLLETGSNPILTKPRASGRDFAEPPSEMMKGSV